MLTQRKVILYIAASLDGYIATEDESLDWLFTVEGEGDNGYHEFYNTVDTILMGRRTYDWIVKMEKGNFPYKNKDCYVFSRTHTGKNEKVEFVNDDIVAFTKSLKESGGKDIWLVGGGSLLHTFMEEKLVDEFIITIAPTLIGSGIPLFPKSDLKHMLQLKNVRRFNQFVQIHYVKK